MRRFSTFLASWGVILGSLTLLALLPLIGTGCHSASQEISNQRPGNFRLGVVVISDQSVDSQSLSGGHGRYIVDSSSVLRASFGAGSTLDTFPGFTRHLNPEQMDAIWLMAKNLLEHNNHTARLHAGQPQSMVGDQAGIIIEVHMNTHDAVFVFDADDQQAAAIVDALAALAWVDTTPSTAP